MKTYVIYKATNLINGKMYIGKTYNFEKRKREHLYDIDNELPFHRALKKYGVENFKWEIIDKAVSDKEIKEKEIYWIKKLNTCIHSKDSQGYNITIGGEGGVSWNSRPIVQYSLEGKRLNEYESCTSASVATGVDRRSILDCAYGEYLTAGKFIWKFKDDCNHPQIQPILPNRNDRFKAVVQLDLDGFLINTFESVKSASEQTKTRRTCLSNCLIGKISTANGFQWIYANEYDPSKDYKYKGKKYGKGIYQLDDNKNILNHFNNCAEASRYLGKPESHHKQISGRLNSTKRCAGYYWMRVEDYENQYGNPEITQ